MENEDKISDLLGKGYDINRDDLFEIQYLLTQIPVERWAGMSQVVYGTLSLIVRDPQYTGDITLDDLD